jgi:hypothetical protein
MSASVAEAEERKASAEAKTSALKASATADPLFRPNEATCIEEQFVVKLVGNLHKLDCGIQVGQSAIEQQRD